MNFVVLTPSRGRPKMYGEMAESVLKYSDTAAEVSLGLDHDDPTKRDYIQGGKYNQYFLYDRMSLSAWTNYLAKITLNRNFAPGYLISMGDDHLVRTINFHLRLKQAIDIMDGPGFAFGDDLMNGDGLCTSWMVSSQVVRALGWMMLPTCGHMYVDNAIMELGEATGRISFVHDVIIEHRHHVIGKSEFDDTYKATNNDEQMERDLKAFRQWRYGPQFKRDVKTVLELKWES